MLKIKSKLNTSVAYDGGAAWSGDPLNVPHKVTLSPGVNELTDLDAKLLKVDPNFAKHMAGGFYDEPYNEDGAVNDRDSEGEKALAGLATRQPNDVQALDGTNAAPASKEAGTEAAPADPRVKLDNEDTDAYRARVMAWQAGRRVQAPGEKAGAYKTRLAGYDAEDGTWETAQKNDVFVADFYALSDAERAAYYETLTPNEKALVDSRKPQ